MNSVVVDIDMSQFLIGLTAAWSRAPVGMLLSIDSREDGREVRLSRSSFDLLRVSYISLVDGVLLNSLYPYGSPKGVPPVPTNPGMAPGFDTPIESPPMPVIDAGDR